jgi:hypothetical protein
MYKVVPFNASIGQNEGSDHAAQQLEGAISQMEQQGFEYAGMESIPTYVAGNNGCFGLGATPATTRQFPVLIFRKR